jgi:hypothetical protein
LKGLMYNVLEALASRSGCSDEAWELVVEFAAAEALLDQASSVTRALPQPKARLSYASPAEAMIKCLSQEHSGAGFSSLPPLLDRADEMLTFVECNRPEDLRPSCGFSAEAFLCPDALLDAWGEDWEVPSDEEEALGYWGARMGHEKKRPVE